MPGPWVVEPITENVGYRYSVGCKHGWWVAAIANHEDAEANARLIAAAPELLEVVKAVAAHFADTDAPLFVAARAAVAKAEGR